MSPHAELVGRALEAARVDPPHGYSWLGRAFSTAPEGDGAGPEEARARLVEALTHRLYSDLYCRGEPVPVSASPPPPSRRLSAFVEALSEANRGSGSWEPGWEVHGLDGDRLVVGRDGLRLWADPDEVRAAGGVPALPGARAAVRLPKELVRMSPGFYLALGDRGLDLDAGEPLVRLYWNVRPADAADLLGAVAGALNETDVAFRFKVLDAAWRYPRCDAAVLYLERRGREGAGPPVASVAAAFAGRLNAATPAFTRRLAPGLGFAEDPGGNRSFGRERCRLLAEALLRAHERGERSAEGRVAVAREVFAETGVSLDAPYLNPGSRVEDAVWAPFAAAPP